MFINIPLSEHCMSAYVRNCMLKCSNTYVHGGRRIRRGGGGTREGRINKSDLLGDGGTLYTLDPMGGHTVRIPQ
jgi:hypothetical protein